MYIFLFNQTRKEKPPKEHIYSPQKNQKKSKIKGKERQQQKNKKKMTERESERHLTVGRYAEWCVYIYKDIDGCFTMPAVSRCLLYYTVSTIPSTDHFFFFRTSRHYLNKRAMGGSAPESRSRPCD